LAAAATARSDAVDTACAAAADVALTVVLTACAAAALTAGSVVMRALTEALTEALTKGVAPLSAARAASMVNPPAVAALLSSSCPVAVNML
jgi:hypothetical protein